MSGIDGDINWRDKFIKTYEELINMSAEFVLIRNNAIDIYVNLVE